MNFDNLVADAAPLLVETFATTVTYTPQVGSTFTLSAIRSDGKILDQESAGAYEVLDCPPSAFSAPPAVGDAVTMGSADYNVYRIERDQYPFVRLILRRIV